MNYQITDTDVEFSIGGVKVCMPIGEAQGFANKLSQELRVKAILDSSQPKAENDVEAVIKTAKLRMDEETYD